MPEISRRAFPWPCNLTRVNQIPGSVITRTPLPAGCAFSWPWRCRRHHRLLLFPGVPRNNGILPFVQTSTGTETRLFCVEPSGYFNLRSNLAYILPCFVSYLDL